MQDTLLRSLAICRICGGPDNTRAYVLRMATNLWIDELRRKQRSREAAETLAIAAPVALHEPAEPLLDMIAAELPAREYEALILTAVYGYTGAETARLLDTTAGAVKMATSRARRRLRQLEVELGA